MKHSMKRREGIAIVARLIVAVVFSVVQLGEAPAFFIGGTVYAQTPQRQEVEENSATEGASQGKEALKGMEALSDLATTQPVTKEFLRALENRRKNLDVREKTVARQEQELLLLRQDIEAKLARLEKMRSELEDMTKLVDKSRKKDLARAAQVYAAMDPAQTAKIFNQMDLESVVAILKEMDVETAGGILSAMTADPGTDSAKMEKLKAIGESLVDPKKMKKP